MSASLVGSEMCIRDSPPPPGEAAQQSAANRCRQFAAPGLGLSVTWGLLPVSYTHLTLPTICSV
eukprot:12861317-Alexandrium_andersonii.AAC.1